MRLQIRQQSGHPYPAEMAYADTSQQLTITRTGDVITIYPARDKWDEMIEQLRSLPKPSKIEPFERTEMPERDWD